MIEAVTPELINQARQGDKVVLTSLYERYRVSIFRYLYYRVGDIHLAEDLTSEVFLRMLAALKGYRPQVGAFKAWLFQIARNLAIDHYRRHRNQRQASLDEDLEGGDEAPEAVLQRQLTSARLVSALKNLNEAQRDVIVLRFISELSLAQVAQTLHKSEDSVKGLQRRGLLALRQILSAEEVNNA